MPLDMLCKPSVSAHMGQQPEPASPELLPSLSWRMPMGPHSFSAAASASAVRPLEYSQRGLSGVTDSPASPAACHLSTPTAFIGTFSLKEPYTLDKHNLLGVQPKSPSL